MRGLLAVAWAVLAALLVWYAAYFKAPAIQQDILSRTAEAVRPLNPQAEVLVDGRNVTLRGPERDETSRARTLAAADAVWGALGPVDALWVPIVTRASEYILADKGVDGRLRLTGSVPTEAARTAAGEAAQTAFPAGSVDNRLIVSGGAAPPMLSGFGDAIRELAKLDVGSLFASAQGFRLSGSTKDTANADAAAELAAAQPDRWQVFVNGPDLPPPPPSTPGRFSATKTPEGAFLAMGEIPSEDARTALIEIFQAGDADRRIIDRLTIRPEGLPDGWTARAVAGARALAELDWGSLSLEGARSFLDGMAPPDRVAEIGDSLGAAYVTELAPRPVDPNLARIAELEAQMATTRSQLDAAEAKGKQLQTDLTEGNLALDAASQRVLALAAQAAKNVADLDAAQARIRQLTSSGESAGVELETALGRVSDLEAAEAKARSDLDTANRRIAELLAQQTAEASRPTPATTGGVAVANAPPITARAPDAPPVNEEAAACNAAVGTILSEASITFEPAKAQITGEGNALLDRLVNAASVCIGNPALKVTIGGHTDSQGNDRANLRLSQARADAVKEALIVRSIPPEAITAIGYGEAQPVSDNSSEEGMRRNRRITIDWSLK